jgi:hypothetical protein
MSARTTTVVSVLAACAFSCGRQSSGAAEYVAAFCDLVRPCCASASLPADGKQCRAFLQPLVASSGYDAEAGDACLAALRADSARPDFCQGTGAPASEACGRVFLPAGTGKPGDRCGDFDCGLSPEGRVACSIGAPGASEPRICQLQVRGKEGDHPCVGTIDGDSGRFPVMPGPPPVRASLCHVADGLRCDEATFACVKLRQAGESCEQPEACAHGNYCNLAMHVCQPSKPAGQACEPSLNQTDCVDGSYCAYPSMSCAPRLADGSACQSSEQCLSDGCTGGKCESSGLALYCGQP